MKKIILISSIKDVAGSNIHQMLIENFGFQSTDLIYDSCPVYSLDGRILLCSTQKEIVHVGSELDQMFGSGDACYVFLSKHRAESQIPSLTAHFPGNLNNANEFGGRPRELSLCSPSLLKNYMLALNSLRQEIPEKYMLTLEATHHGPTGLKNPSMFVELGSSDHEWSDAQAAACIAKALTSSLMRNDVYTKCAIALGGTHYPNKFNKLILESDLALGHIAPKYAVQQVDEEMISQMIQKSDEKISIVAVDMKGLGKDKNRILELVAQSGLELYKA